MGTLSLVPPTVAGAAEPHRSWWSLPSSNGWGGIVADLGTGAIHHFREHSYATEEPRWSASGAEQWAGAFPEVVYSRDLLGGIELFLTHGTATSSLQDGSLDLEQSHWAGLADGERAGTGIVQLVEAAGPFSVRRMVFAPWTLERAAGAVVISISNPGTAATEAATLRGLLDLHLGPGRPGPAAETGNSGEFIHCEAGAVEERGFAGVVAASFDPQPSRCSVYAPPLGVDLAGIVAAGGEVPEGPSTLGVQDDSRLAWSWAVPPLGPGQSVHFGLVFAHHGDPFAIDQLRSDVDNWTAGRDAELWLADERAHWTGFQSRVQVPTGADADEERVLRQGAAVLAMAQVREDGAYLREVLWDDGTARHHPETSLPGWVPHRGKGALLASLPPGQWTYSWPRDASYAIAGLSRMGLFPEAREGLRHLLGAETGVFEHYDELAHYPMIPYQISLCRHHGFGREESDTSGGGDFNFEFDGPGLVLWAMEHYEHESGDPTLVDEHWDIIRDEVAGFLLAMIDPETGLVRKDSSIWEHHWLGLERTWTYTSLVGARGLCSAATLADRRGEADLAEEWRLAAMALREAIRTRLVNDRGALSQTAEERATGGGDLDAATAEGIAMGLFDPRGPIASATLDALIAGLRVPSGGGFSRNDDRTDAHSLSPWGSSYDSDEWVVMDLRIASAALRAGLTGLSDELIHWVTAQSSLNFDAIGETYDPWTADYTNNAPMVGFGPGAYALALFDRAEALAGLPAEPACGAYAEEPEAATPTPDDATPWPMPATDRPTLGCTGGGMAALILVAAAPWRSRRRRRS